MKNHLSLVVWSDESLGEASNPHIRLGCRGALSAEAPSHPPRHPPGRRRLSQNSGLLWSAWEKMHLESFLFAVFGALFFCVGYVFVFGLGLFHNPETY